MKKLLISLFVISSLFYGNYIYAEDNQELYFIDAHSQIDHQVSGINLVLERMADNNVKTTLLATRGKRNWRDILEWNSTHPDKIIPLIRTKDKHIRWLSIQESMENSIHCIPRKIYIRS